MLTIKKNRIYFQIGSFSLAADAKFSKLNLFLTLSKNKLLTSEINAIKILPDELGNKVRLDDSGLYFIL